MRKIEERGAVETVDRGHKDEPAVHSALQLTPMLLQRPGELRGASWAETDLDAGAVNNSGGEDEAQQGRQGKRTASPCPAADLRTVTQALL